MGLVEHPDNPGGLFDERRCGLDHVSFAVTKRGDIDEIARRAAAVIGTDKPQVNESPDAVLLGRRDPDHIQVEVCYWKTAESSA
jgi:hypothetical protein